MLLTKDNYYLYAANNYDNPQCLSEEEFMEDLRLVVSIKKMLTRLSNDSINIKLTMNMIITFYNVFDHHAASNIMSYRLTEQEKKSMNSFLSFMNLPSTNHPEQDEELLNTITKEYETT